jgi:tetratricopeptide (TPR) repeat protein
MIDEVASRIKEAESSTAKGEEAVAMLIANGLVESAPEDERVWSFRAYLHARNREYPAALADWTHAIAIAPEDISLFLGRGTHHLRCGQSASALADFDEALRLSDVHGNDYFRQTLHFLRAEVLLQLGRRDEALIDLQRLPDGFRYRTRSLRTKEDLTSECLKGPVRPTG